MALACVATIGFCLTGVVGLIALDHGRTLRDVASAGEGKVVARPILDEIPSDEE